MKSMFHMLHYISIIQLVLKSSTLIIYCASCKWSIHMEPSFSTFLMLFPWYKLQENISYLKEENALNEHWQGILHNAGNEESLGKNCQGLKLRLWDPQLWMISASSHLWPGPDPAVLPGCSSEFPLCSEKPCQIRNGIPAEDRARTSPFVAIRPQVVCLQDLIQNALRPVLHRRERAVVIKQTIQHCARGRRCISPPPRPLPGTDSQQEEDSGSLSPLAAESGRERKTQSCLQPHTALTRPYSVKTAIF